MPSIGQRVFASCSIPDVNSAKACRSNSTAIWCPCDIVDIAQMIFIHDTFLTRPRIPDMYRLITSAGGHGLAIRRPRHRLNTITVILVHDQRHLSCWSPMSSPVLCSSRWGLDHLNLLRMPEMLQRGIELQFSLH